MSAVAAISSDLSVGSLVRAAAPAPVTAPNAVRLVPSATADMGQSDGQNAGFSASLSQPKADATQPSVPLQTRSVTFSDAATGVLIQADQDSRTGATVSQFPDRALIESYQQQLRRQVQDQASTQAVNT